MFEFFTEFLKLYGGSTAVLLLGVLIALVWLLAHWITLPGKEVSVLFGLAKYTKGQRNTESSAEFHSFCQRIVGHWWSFRNWDRNSLSYVNIFLYEPTRTVKVIGDAYDREVNLIAHWESQASCINPSERKLYYYWTG